MIIYEIKANVNADRLLTLTRSDNPAKSKCRTFANRLHGRKETMETTIKYMHTKQKIGFENLETVEKASNMWNLPFRVSFQALKICLDKAKFLTA